MVRWPAVGAGFLIAFALSLLAGVLLGRSTVDENPGILAVPSFVALFAGGYVAGRLAGRAGLANGVAVAVIFIFVGASIKALQELVLAAQWGPFAIGPMNMGGLLLGDLIHLCAATLGGWLAESQLQRRELAPPPADPGNPGRAGSRKGRGAHAASHASSVRADRH
ncbi:MAG TPA: YrzE family protein [Chloroflexota bacterium]|nr:YrzE family protein [Chloroflexota bacterium]